ncbi:MAG TPA: efflux RND transporter periplasmic adaptor subunit [Pirellula sp.]|nr:efflux RND transporter periplasmic adaptor subunit [Pirellula sp.]
MTKKRDTYCAWSAFIGLMLFQLSCSKPAESENVTATATAELPKVATVKPKRMALTQKTEQPAKIEAFSMTRIHAKVNGFIDQILVDIGDRVTGPKKDDQGNIVEPGQLLAVLVAPELSDELAQKEAMIAQAEADIDQAKAAVEVAESLAVSAEANVAESVAGQRKVEAEYQRWKSEAERISVLASTKTVTAKLAEETTQQMKGADAAREEVAARIQSAKAKQNESNVAISKAKADLRSIEAKLKIARAEYQRVKSLCAYMQIRAPYTGIISVRNFDPGSLMQVSQANNENPLFTIVQTDKVRVSLNVPETEAVLVNYDGKAAIKVPALNNRVFEGKVARTSWVLSTSTRTLECEIEVSNAEGVLRPGMYANVELIIAQKADILALPRSAIVQQDGKPTCLVVAANGMIVRRALQTGIVTPTDIEVVSGLEDQEDVIFANASAFKEDQKVAMTAKK